MNTPCRSTRHLETASPCSPGATELRALITGAAGFAGVWLTRACAAAGDEVVALSRAGAVPDAGGEGLAVDLRDRDGVRSALRDVAPDVVYHLAALSSVGRSWEDPARTVQENVTTAVNVLEALRLETPAARVVWVSTCEVYGAPTRLPVSEDAPLQPVNPYAVSKTTGDLLAAVYADAYELEIVRMRPFSHVGPGQRSIFILSSLARQAAEGRIAGAERIQIVTGNPDTRRDYTDVRDVVRAYRLAADGAAPDAYNVSSGRSTSAAELVELIGQLIAPIEIEHVVDPARVRAREVMELRGTHDRLTATTGWKPEIAFEQTLADTIEWWEHQLARAQPPGAVER